MEMQTSKQWWDETKADPAKLIEWLKNQFHGELTASARIREFLKKFPTSSKAQSMVLDVIADQEYKHAWWVSGLLTARGAAAVRLTKEERYWAHTLPEITSFESGCAVAAKAEEMRLERIRVIVEDEDAPLDIRAVFAKILPEEQFHAQAFKRMASAEALANVSPAHARGLESLGLVL